MISIIIPAYNEEKYIESTLKSIKTQDFKDYELIVVCNGCIDNTEKIARKYTNKIFVLEKPNKEKAQNLAAEKAKGDLLFFIDADIILQDKRTLEKVSKLNLGTCKSKPIEKELRFKIFLTLKNIFCKIGMTNGLMFIKKDLFHKVNGFREGTFPMENKALINNAKKFNKYKVISPYISWSMRRYQRFGILGLTIYWSKAFFFHEVGKYKPIR